MWSRFLAAACVSLALTPSAFAVAVASSDAYSSLRVLAGGGLGIFITSGGSVSIIDEVGVGNGSTVASTVTSGDAALISITDASASAPPFSLASATLLNGVRIHLSNEGPDAAAAAFLLALRAFARSREIVIVALVFLGEGSGRPDHAGRGRQIERCPGDHHGHRQRQRATEPVSPGRAGRRDAQHMLNPMKQ